MREVKFYNTLSKKKEIFKPIEERNVKLYSCGPTVYSTPHIGNMRAYTFVDTLVRTLKLAGYNVQNLINITDVGHLTSDADEGEDKLEKAARLTGKDAYAIAKEHTETFYKYLNLLNISKPSGFPKATEHIDEQIDMIKTLEEKGFTYIINDGVYFDTSKFPNYTKFANINTDGLRDGIRVDIGQKTNKTDFALWKFSPENEKRLMEWDSPWGIGFPGWHIECSAMAKKHLGDKIDIHTGGIDHIHVHHTNEIAQSEAVTGEQFVNYWLHVNFLQILKTDTDEKIDDAEDKMSKSKGTAYTLDQLVDMGVNPLVLKYFYLTAHYRNELKFNFDILNKTKKTFENIQNKVFDLKQKKYQNEKIDESSADNILTAMFNDLDTVTALAEFHKMLNDSNLNTNTKINTIKVFDELFGLELMAFEKESFVLPENIIELAEKRKIARLNNEWNVSDDIRDQLNNLGYEIKDNKNDYNLVKKEVDFND